MGMWMGLTFILEYAQAGFDHFRWLDINHLAQKLLKPDQGLAGLKYFTSRVSNDPDKQKRQSTYSSIPIRTGNRRIAEQFLQVFQQKEALLKARLIPETTG